jgi:hypothetical protein
MRRKKQDTSLQMSLWTDEQPQVQQQEIPAEEIHHKDQSELLDLLTYTHASLKYHGPEDNVRREWLAAWAETRGYKAFPWTCHDKYSGYTQHHIEDGEANWQHFLNVAGSFNIYCCYVTACAPHPLSHYLEDAVARGEIRQLEDKLIWRPGDHGRPRGERG